MAPKNWIKGAIKHPGGLHRALGVPQGQTIPADMMEPDPHDSTHMKRMKAMARTMGKMRK